MGLFKKAWEDKDSKKRIAAIREKLDDQETLMQIAATDWDVDVRLEALKKIRDDGFLAAYAEAIDDQSLCWAAIDHISSIEALFTLAASTSNVTVAKHCMFVLLTIKEWNDQKLLKQLVHTAKTNEVIAEALGVIEDVAYLEEYARIPYNPAKGATFDRIENQEIFKAIALNEKTSSARHAAIHRLVDTAALAKIITDSDEKRTYVDSALRRMEELGKARVDAAESYDEFFWMGIESDFSCCGDCLRYALSKITSEEAVTKLYRYCMKKEHPAPYLEYLITNANAPDVLCEIALNAVFSDRLRKLALEELRKVGTSAHAERLLPLIKGITKWERWEKEFSESRIWRLYIDDEINTLGANAVWTIAELKGLSKYELMAKEGDEAYLEYQLERMKFGDGWHGGKEAAVVYVRAFYEAGRYRDKIRDYVEREHIDSSIIDLCDWPL